MPRVVIVTGSTRGIGRAIVERFASEGWSCLVNSRSSHEDGKVLAAGLADAQYVAGDVGNPLEAENLVARAVERWGRVDVLVNNAAITTRIPHRDLDAVTPQLWEEILRVNVIGAWNMVKAAAPALRAVDDGSVINVSSLAGRRAAGSCLPYSVSKAALDQLTVTLAAALAPEVRVNAVAPGFIDNDRRDDREAVKELVSKRAPLRRPGLPEEVAYSCWMMAGATYVTGEVLLVDGGLHVR